MRTDQNLKSALIAVNEYLKEIKQEGMGEKEDIEKLDVTIDILSRLSESLTDPKKNKYSREIKPGVWVDVYDVLRAFPTGCSAMDHAAKKVLAAGKRGHKDTITDKKDIIASVTRSMEQDAEWGE